MAGVEYSQKLEGARMKLFISALLSAALIWLVPAHTPASVKKQAVRAAKANKVQSAQPVQPQPETKAAKMPQMVVHPITHLELMAAAGISPADYGAVDYIVTHESNWNPNATEPTSGAHGLPQALPYSKTGCGWSDSICQLRWANSYAAVRYGGWWNAYAYWAVHRNW